MSDPDLADPGYLPEHEEPQRRRGRPPKAPAAPAETAPTPPELVTIVCIADCKPWVDFVEFDQVTNEKGQEIFLRRIIAQRPLALGEKVTIEPWIADTLIANKHAVRV